MSFSRQQIESTSYIGAAAQRVMENARLAMVAGGDRAMVKDALAAMDAEVGGNMMMELATAMYEAACRVLVFKGMAYPPLRPEHFLALEDVASSPATPAVGS